MTAAIGLGSNLGDPRANLDRAVSALARAGRVRARSSTYRTKAWGVADQPDFYNAVVLLETELGARELLRVLKTLEAEIGRRPTYRWGPRVIDLDILTYGSQQIAEPDLVVPHARLAERAFVLVPLAELDPAFAAARDALSAEMLAEVEPLDEQKPAPG